MSMVVVSSLTKIFSTQGVHARPIRDSLNVVHGSTEFSDECYCIYRGEDRLFDLLLLEFDRLVINIETLTLIWLRLLELSDSGCKQLDLLLVNALN